MDVWKPLPAGVGARRFLALQTMSDGGPFVVKSVAWKGCFWGLTEQAAKPFLRNGFQSVLVVTAAAAEVAVAAAQGAAVSAGMGGTAVP